MRHTKIFSTVLIHSDKGENVIPLDYEEANFTDSGKLLRPQGGVEVREFYWK